MSIASEHRKAMPLGVKLKAALALAGFSEEQIETPGAIQFDHSPALVLRSVDDETGQLVPPANDWRAIVPRAAAEHLQKTTGRKPGAERTATTAGSDIGNGAKLKRIAKRQEREREVRASAADDEIDRPKRVDRGGDDMKRLPKSRWPKGQKIKSPGFRKKPRKPK